MFRVTSKIACADSRARNLRIALIVILTIQILLASALSARSIEGSIEDGYHRGNLSVISPRLQYLLEQNDISGAMTVPVDTLVEALVLFSGAEAQKEYLRAGTPATSTLAERRQSTLTRLLSFHSSSEETALQEINRISGAKLLQRFWLMRAALVLVPLDQLSALSEIPGVTRVLENAPLELSAFTETTPATADEATSASGPLESMSVPTLWERGITGAGRVVASFDTGVEGVHPALSSSYLGQTIGAGAFFGPNTSDTISTDISGHGTHTMGLMIGSNDIDTFGIAPGASWISAAVVDQGSSLNGTLADILSAFQWALNPDGDITTTNDVPDVILNSWGLPTGLLGPCDETFWQVIDNVEAAGIVTIFAVGNEGPTPMSIRSPANRISSSINAFSVGAIDHNNLLVADFSSRGPSTCDSATVKPEVVAPGINIYSSDKNGTYSLRSGTSMAAPYVAGLVALLRQYNPNATVTQIKQAIMASCQDLGAIGNDNSYGAGLPDAARALALLAPPVEPIVTISDIRVLDTEGLALPGQQAQLSITLQAPVGTLDSLGATLSSLDISKAKVSGGASVFLLSTVTGRGTNLTPFVLELDPSLLHGEVVRLTLHYFAVNGVSGELELELPIGVEPPGAVVTISSGSLTLGVTGFGKFGLAQGSAYPTGGAGFSYLGGANLLFESGVVIGRNELQLSSAIRDSLGRSYNTDFSPQDQISLTLTSQVSQTSQASSGATVSEARYIDTRSAVPIPITISQRISAYSQDPDNGYLIFEFNLINQGLETVTNLRFGLFNDFDLDSLAGDQVGFDDGLQMMYQYSTDAAVGILSLTDQAGARAMANTISSATGKTPFTQRDKYATLQVNSIDIETSAPADMMFQMNYGPFSIKPGDSQLVVLALAAGTDLSDLARNAEAARRRWLTPTGTDEGDTEVVLPESFSLGQNYPNPFNPSTTIEFTSSRRENLHLAVYNILGREVRTLLDGPVGEGSHQLVWDGLDNKGSRVASGVYFYRLNSSSQALTKKMVLLK